MIRGLVASVAAASIVTLVSASAGFAQGGGESWPKLRPERVTPAKNPRSAKNPDATQQPAAAPEQPAAAPGTALVNFASKTSDRSKELQSP